MLVDQWLPRIDRAVSPGDARADMLRRYLGTYGPSTPNAFAEWAGIGASDARARFATIADETLDATIDGRKAGVLLATDVKRATESKAVAGIRFLPPFDPYLLDRDRQTLVPTRDDQMKVWRASGAPGLLLVDGEPAGTWRTRTTKSEIAVTVDPFGIIVPAADLEPEAQVVAKSSGKDVPVSVTIS